MYTYAYAVDDDSLLSARSLPRLGQAIRALRLERGLTQVQLANAAGVSRLWIVQIESGRKAGAEVGLVMRVLDALDASLMVRDDRRSGDARA